MGADAVSPVVFVHGLGGSTEAFIPLIQSLRLAENHSLHLFDFEGHGLSPTSPLSKLSVSSLAEDLNGVFEHADISAGATLVAHSMGCLIAVKFVLANPGKVSKLILLGPPPSPLPDAGTQATQTLATTARTKGMAAVVDAVANAGTSEKTKASNPLAIIAIRLSLLGQDPEGYAKACTALAEAEKVDFGGVEARTLIVTGDEDEVSAPQLCESYVEQIKGQASLNVLDGVGHWHMFEDVVGVSEAVGKFLA